MLAAYRISAGRACSSAWMTFSVAACASETFSFLILARTIITFIDRSPLCRSGLCQGHERAAALGTAGSGLFEPPGQEPPLGGRGSQLQRPAVRHFGLVAAAKTAQQLAAGRVVVKVA